MPLRDQHYSQSITSYGNNKNTATTITLATEPLKTSHILINTNVTCFRLELYLWSESSPYLCSMCLMDDLHGVCKHEKGL